MDFTVGFSENTQDIDISYGSTVVVHEAYYVHTQSTAATTWTITHNLNKRPSVTLVDGDEEVIIGEITYVSDNQVQVTFSTALTGKAYLN